MMRGLLSPQLRTFISSRMRCAFGATVAMKCWGALSAWMVTLAILIPMSGATSKDINAD